MLKKSVLIAVALVAMSSTAWAQTDTRMQVSVLFGYTVSDGVSGDAFAAPNGKVYDRIDPTDGGNWGLQVGFNVSPQSELGFMYRQQMGKLALSGPSAETELGDLTTHSYHGYFAYYFGDPEGKVNPYFLMGLGATQFAAVSFTPPSGVTIDETPSSTEFSTVWGTGVRVNASKNVGLKFGLAWTPTYIKSDPDGWWCGWYGCYVVGDAQYANQFHFEGAISFRF